MNYSKPKPIPTAFLCLMTLMGTVALMSSDIHIAAMPSLQALFGVEQQTIQLTFSVYLLGICTGQTLFGFYLNRFPVRKVALFSLMLFIFASLCCAKAPTLASLIVGRFFQALGASVCSIIYRSIVAARYNQAQVAHILSIIFPIAGLSPAIAPYIGGILATHYGWRSIFLFSASYGLLVLCFVAKYLEDTPQQDNRPEQSIQQANYSQQLKWVLSNRLFWGYCLVVAMAFAAFRGYTAESPFVFHELGFSSAEIGRFYFPLSLSYVAGNIATNHLLRKQSVEKIMAKGLGIMVLGSLLMLGLASLHLPHPEAVYLSMSVVTFSNGLLIPCGNAAALTSVPSRLTGIAAALIGMTQLLVAMSMVYVIPKIAAGQFFPLALVIFLLALAGVANYVTFLRPHTSNETTDLGNLEVES